MLRKQITVTHLCFRCRTSPHWQRLNSYDTYTWTLREGDDLPCMDRDVRATDDAAIDPDMPTDSDCLGCAARLGQPCEPQEFVEAHIVGGPAGFRHGSPSFPALQNAAIAASAWVARRGGGCARPSYRRFPPETRTPVGCRQMSVRRHQMTSPAPDRE